MDKILVAVFDNDTKAYEGVNALMDLDREGSIGLYTYSVFSTDAKGTPSVKQEPDNGPLGTLVGLTTGTLVGMVGGPAGVAAGAGIGGLAGMFSDLNDHGVRGEFLDEIASELGPNKTALVAEIWEEWVTPLDTRMEAAGAVVHRRPVYEVEDTIARKEYEAMSAEAAAFKQEAKRERGEAKANVEAKAKELEDRRKAFQARIDKKLSNADARVDAKLNTLEDRSGKAKSDVKAKIDAHVSDLRASTKKHIDAMKKAWKEAGDRLTI